MQETHNFFHAEEMSMAENFVSLMVTSRLQQPLAEDNVDKAVQIMQRFGDVPLLS